jgi:hypothetical protein
VRQINCGGGDVGKTKNASNGPDVGARFEEIVGERMAERITGEDAGGIDGFLDKSPES